MVLIIFSGTNISTTNIFGTVNLGTSYVYQY